MKTTIDKLISNTEIIKVTISLADDCNNGYDTFEVSGYLFTKGIIKDAKRIMFNNRIFSEDTRCSDEDILKHFPQLAPIIAVDGRDNMGVSCYPIMNGHYFLKTDFKHGIKYLSLTETVGKEILKYDNFNYGEYLKIHIKKILKPMADEAILILEALCGKKYVRNNIVSPYLFNDLHYKLITEKSGWNVYKEVQNKSELTYSDITNIKSDDK